MNEVKEYTFEELCRIVGAVAVRHGMIRVYLFGSRVRGDNTEGSDYDFCILTLDDYGLFEVGGFYADLREAPPVEADGTYDVVGGWGLRPLLPDSERKNFASVLF